MSATTAGQATVPRWNRVQHPDPDAPRRLHATDHADPAGIEAPCSLHVDPGFADDDGAKTPVSICVDFKLDLSPAQARAVGNRLVYLADRLTPASAEGLAALTVALDALNGAWGTSHTLESLAADCRVDLTEATAADVAMMAGHIGGVLASA